MKLAVSNIAWTKAEDHEMLQFLMDNNINGIEIAPTRMIEENPYKATDEIIRISQNLKLEYQLDICSLQSIWYGRSEKLFNSEEEYKALLSYTKEAIDFASAIGCHNLVFGSPKNRRKGSFYNEKNVQTFFYELGEYALQKNTVLAMEANPIQYGTDFINDTFSAYQLVKKIDSAGFKINLDLGTVLYNDEKIVDLQAYLPWINHIHISDFDMQAPQVRSIHQELAKILRDHYSGYVSLEMKSSSNLNSVKTAIHYLKEVFG